MKLERTLEIDGIRVRVEVQSTDFARHHILMDGRHKETFFTTVTNAAYNCFSKPEQMDPLDDEERPSLGDA